MNAFTAAATAATILGAALTMNGCPPPDPNPPAPRCVTTITLTREPYRESLAGIDPSCIVNVYMDPTVRDGQYPWRRCVSYWQGKFYDDPTSGAYICVDITP